MPAPIKIHRRIDSHQHFWDIARLDYPWMPAPPSVLRRNYLPGDLAQLLTRNEIDATVLVQAHQSVEEANFLLDIAEDTDFVAGVVAWVDLTSPDVGDVLDELMKRGKLVSIRHQVEDEPDVAWLSRENSIRGLREVAARGLRYDLLLKAPHLKYVPQLAERVPDLRMVVNHIGKPLISQGIKEPWAADMAAIAEITSIFCKVSGMVTEADHRSWSVGDLKPYVHHIVEIFGIDRLMFGSDWPVCLLAAGYDQVLCAALEAIGPLSDEDAAKFMGGNASAFYGLS